MPTIDQMQAEKVWESWELNFNLNFVAACPRRWHRRVISHPQARLWLSLDGFSTGLHECAWYSWSIITESSRHWRPMSSSWDSVQTLTTPVRLHFSGIGFVQSILELKAFNLVDRTRITSTSSTASTLETMIIYYPVDATGAELTLSRNASWINIKVDGRGLETSKVVLWGAYKVRLHWPARVQVKPQGDFIRVNQRYVANEYSMQVCSAQVGVWV